MTDEQRDRRASSIVLAVVTLAWSTTFIVTKDVVRGASPLVYLSIRFGLASVVLIALRPLLAGRGPARSLDRRLLLVDGLVLGGWQAIGLLLQVVGQVYTTASKSAFVTTLATVLTPLLALLVHREQPSRPQLLGVALASGGLYFLTYPVGGAQWNVGDLLTLCCAVAYAFVIVETGRRSRRHTVGDLAAAQTVVAALAFVVLLGAAQAALALLPPERWPAVLRLEARPLSSLGGKFALQLGYMALVCTVGTFLAQTWAMGRMTATAAAVIFTLEPVFASGLAMAVDGAAEWPGPRGALGAGLVLAGVVAAELRWKTRAT